VCVYHRGECVVDVWAGWRDDAGTPWGADTMAPSFSTTKGVTSTCVHVMVERGLLDYDAPVAAYWPEFAQAGKERITVRQVLAHQSGLYHIRQMVDRADRMLDWSHMIAAIERTTPVHPPGMRTGWLAATRSSAAKPRRLDSSSVGATPCSSPPRRRVIVKAQRGSTPSAMRPDSFFSCSQRCRQPAMLPSSTASRCVATTRGPRGDQATVTATRLSAPR